MKTIQKDIIIVENDTIISENIKVAEKLNNFFSEAVENLDIIPYLPKNLNETLTENLQEIIDKYDNHPSIVKLMKMWRSIISFLS